MVKLQKVASIHMPIYLLLLVTAFSILGCRKENRKEIPFVSYVDIHPAGLDLVHTHHFVLRDIPGVPYEKILEAQPAYVRFSLIYGENDLDFLRDVTVDAVTDTSRQEMGYHEFIPITNSRELELNPSIVDLREHVTQEYFDIMLNLEFRSVPVAETRLRIDFGVLAKMDEE
ncbi:MAG: hypothetical protein GY810_31760 [Aureispira sp.]|nr:hypothetical protein [Aureispira sp.]